MKASLPMWDLIAGKRPLVIGHRGYCQIAPENTLPSFKLAMAAGVDLVELDYHQSKDRKLVVIHDAELDRTTDAASRWGRRNIEVASTTAAEIQTLDAGSWFDPKYPGTKVPLLAEALEVIQAGSATLIEHKAGAPEKCIKLLEEKGLINKVVVQSFNWRYLKAFHRQCPEQILAALGPPTHASFGKKVDPEKLPEEEKRFHAGWLDDLIRTGAKVAVWNNQMSKGAVAVAHEHGLKVWAYTINDSAVADRLLDAGVNGLITNNPSLMWRTIALRQRPQTWRL